MGEVENSDFVGGPNVKDLAHRLGVFGQGNDGLNGIVDVQETAGLLAISVHSERFSAQALLDETGDDHTILAYLTGTHGVEQTKNHHG
jgi:hypothetical protein